MAIKQGERRVSDVLPDSGVQFHPDLPKRLVKDLIGRDLRLLEARFVRDWNLSDGRKSSFYLIRVADPETGEEFTTSIGGVAMEQISKLVKLRAIPVLFSVECVQANNSGNTYYKLR